MAWRFRKLSVSDGDILDPYHWVRSMNEFAAEFNGYLDRDNLRKGTFAAADMALNSCNQVWSSSSTSAQTVNTSISSWQLRDTISTVSFYANATGTLKVTWGATWEWDNKTSVTGITERKLDDDMVQYRLLVDGLEVSISGMMSSVARRDSVYLCAAVPISPGDHTVSVEVRAFSINSDNDYDPLTQTSQTKTDQNLDAAQNEDTRTLTIQNRELIAHLRKR